MTDLKMLKRDVQTALDRAACMSNRFLNCPVNWAHLRCMGVSECHTEDEATQVRVEIEEAAPEGNDELREFILSVLDSRGWRLNREGGTPIDIEFHW